ncbi:metallophosphoesterase [Marinobacterium sp. BA1]|uniref:metallophosphoesterase n=1 Tax=Marinobacterium sp. BA1 TaxID=3138931 RepID=UPI0032E6EBC0
MQTNPFLHHYGLNTAGTDYVVGDIHGYFSHVHRALEALGFDPSRDRLFCCGDLLDRGPESDAVHEWLAHPWVHSVRGNHDDYVVRFRTVTTDNWIQNGGLWFQGLSRYEQQDYADLLSTLPLAIEVETETGLVGIVHADPIVRDWHALPTLFTSRRDREGLMWSRKRFDSYDDRIVENIACVCVGHCPVIDPVLLGNVWHLDTAGWSEEGYFTVMRLEDLARRAVMSCTQAGG